MLFGAIQLTASEAEDLGAERLRQIHSKLKIDYGNPYSTHLDESPEQLMVAMYLPPEAKVLELGGAEGRNTCVIASILNDSHNLVTIETRRDPIYYLKQNRDVNGFHFLIETAALSMRPLVQKGYFSIPSEVDLPDSTRIKTITFKDLQKKHKIAFDTLVVDCEGALYYILQDDPGLLSNIKLVIIENDFHSQNQIEYVENLFMQNGLELVYSQGSFYKVWKK
jgi:hypothetical protein